MPRPRDFCLMQREIGFLQQIVGSCPVFKRHNDTKTGADIDPVPHQLLRFIESAQYALRKTDRLPRLRDTRLGNRELIAADASNKVRFRTARRNRAPMVFSNASPIRWPRSSLTALNRSRSIQCTASPSLSARAVDAARNAACRHRPLPCEARDQARLAEGH